jgi:hypothetical protein
MELPIPDRLLKSFASNYEILPPDGDMFSNSLVQWEDVSVLHIKGDVYPTEENAPKTRRLIDGLLPLIKGKEGCYGAGGGPLYLMFFSGNLETLWDKNNIPTCDFLLEKMSISSAYRENLEWYSVLDVTHQTMFPRFFEEETDELILRIEEFIGEVDPESPVLGEFSTSPFLPSYIFENYPRHKLPNQVRLLHMGVFCSGIHSSDCTKSCPRDSSMIVSRSTPLMSRNLLYDPGTIYSNPRLALFQTSEGHILSLISLDYLS